MDPAKKTGGQGPVTARGVKKLIGRAREGKKFISARCSWRSKGDYLYREG